MAKSEENNTTTLLGLKDCKVEEVVRGDDRVIVKIMINRGREKCPYCGSAKLYGHGTCDPRHVLHTWMHGTKVYIDLHRQRWKSRDCGYTFTGGKQLLSPCSRLTRQAEAEALWQLRERNFRQVTRELGVGYSTLRRLMAREIDEKALGFIQHDHEIHLVLTSLVSNIRKWYTL